MTARPTDNSDNLAFEVEALSSLAPRHFQRFAIADQRVVVSTENHDVVGLFGLAGNRVGFAEIQPDAQNL